jgi:enterochelin esterase-like enzyme
MIIKNQMSAAIIIFALAASAIAQNMLALAGGESEMGIIIAAREAKGETGLDQITIIPQTSGRADKSEPDASDKNFVESLKSSASPVISGQWVTFIYRGDARDVELVGEMTDWDRRGAKLKPIAGTDIKYISMKFSDDARIEYKYIVDDKWMLDPLNPNKNDNGIGGENNFLIMPGYKATACTAERAGTARGRIETLDLPADAAGRKRAARVYLPPGYDRSNERYPVVYFGDGIEYIDRARATVIADNLIAERRMRPVVMVFLAPIDRNKEYWMNPAYVEWLVKELAPMIDSKYRTKASADSRAIAGASLGGLIAAYAAFTHPEVFGNVIGQSSAFQVNGGRIIADFSASPRKPIKIYLEVGRYEGLIDSNRKMKAALESKGYRVGYKEVSAGHNWTHWADALADGLSHAFPTSARAN